MKPFKEMRIIFLGTPDFAVASLDALVQAGANIVGVVTAPDKPAGRGMQLQSSAVKKYALEHKLHVLQPAKLKDSAFIEELKSLNADLQVVVAFRMLPEVVWDMPPMGTINVHASLLPQYRGAAPINWAIINGEAQTGVTTFKLKHEIDTGDILLQESVPITAKDNAGTVHDKLMGAGAALLVKTILGLSDGSIEERPQTSATSPLKHAPKIFKEDMRIDWNRTTTEIYNLIRGLSPYPAAFSLLNDKQIKIYESHIEPATTGLAAGAFDTDHKTYLRLVANDGWVYIDELQMEGKKRMKIEEFLRGFRS
ncbi:MAG TPA: methionyl-tRNA formyltransferase [Flavipsychrobacter sp.]|nr:methionyl-tRNA formyltransferase [Flavipsychrobacter sp.]